MIVLFSLFATARAVTIDSKATWNIVDGVIPQGLDAEKGCPAGLRLSETKPRASIPISCANIRYSVYDSSVATMGYDEVTIDRSYTERNVVSDNGVCKMHMSPMDSTTAADVYTKGQDMKFFSRYGYCDGTYTGTKHFTETTFVSDRSCQEGSEAVQRINIYAQGCTSGFGMCFSIFGNQNPELNLTKGVNYEFYLNTLWDTFTITSDGNEIGTRWGQLLSINHADFVGELRYNGENPLTVGEITMEDPTGYRFAIYTVEECAFYTGKNVTVISDTTQPYGCMSDGTFNEFDRELYPDDAKCENCMCYKLSYDPTNDKPDAIRADCKEQCAGHDGFLLQWDTSQPRVQSQRDRHRSSCVCAGDGEPISELECVLANHEWISNRFVDQYELTPKDPTVKTGVQTNDVYLHCPGPMCSDGPSEGCWDDTICKVGEKFYDLDSTRWIAGLCPEVSGNVSAVFKSDYGDVMGSTTEIVHPWRLTPTTFLFQVVMSESRDFYDYGKLLFTSYTHYIVGITTDLDGNQLEVKSYTTETIDTGYSNGAMSVTYWDSLPLYYISVRNGIFQDTVSCVGKIDGCPTVSLEFGRVVSEEGVWCDSGWFNNGCQEGCKPGFLEQDCSCGDSVCKAGQYCTKDGDCKDVTKKEKKFLQIRYNSLE